MDYSNYCPSCFREKGPENVCLYCGHPADIRRRQSCLPCWAFINNRYLIGYAYECDKNCIRYKAWDFVSQCVVCAEELFPSELVQRDLTDALSVMPVSDSAYISFEQRKKKVLVVSEAMRKFDRSEYILNVFDCFFENNTAYTITEPLEGITFNKYLELRGGAVDAGTAVAVISPVLSALSEIHAENLIHRNVTPRNIFICSNGKVKLINFKILKESSPYQDSMMTVALTPGYAPPEQYLSKSRQGPFSDIYSAGAVLYRALTGVRPPDSISRTGNDELANPCTINPSIPAELGLAVMKAMSLESELRFKKVSDFAKCVSGEKRVVDIDSELQNIKHQSHIVTAITAAAIVIAIIALAIYLSS